jgi:hypothetical protein
MCKNVLFGLMKQKDDIEKHILRVKTDMRLPLEKSLVTHEDFPRDDLVHYDMNLLYLLRICSERTRRHID